MPSRMGMDHWYLRCSICIAKLMCKKNSFRRTRCKQCRINQLETSTNRFARHTFWHMMTARKRVSCELMGKINNLWMEKYEFRWLSMHCRCDRMENSHICFSARCDWHWLGIRLTHSWKLTIIQSTRIPSELSAHQHLCASYYILGEISEKIQLIGTCEYVCIGVRSAIMPCVIPIAVTIVFIYRIFRRAQDHWDWVTIGPAGPTRVFCE